MDNTDRDTINHQHVILGLIFVTDPDQRFLIDVDGRDAVDDPLSDQRDYTCEIRRLIGFGTLHGPEMRPLVRTERIVGDDPHRIIGNLAADLSARIAMGQRFGLTDEEKTKLTAWQTAVSFGQ